MPIILIILLAERHCFIGLIIGIPPPTLASNNRLTSLVAARSKSSFPCFEITSYLPLLHVFHPVGLF